MLKDEALALMTPPSKRRPHVRHGGIIQILITSKCNLACVACTQSSQLRGGGSVMTVEQFELACKSLKLRRKRDDRRAV